MNIWQQMVKLWDVKQGVKPNNNLPEIVDNARREWLAAHYFYKTVTDPDLIDYAIYLIKAYERRYIYLLKKARREGCSHCGIMSGITEERTMRQTF